VRFMRILITAGPTREYIDDVRFLSNASSGRMGYALAEAAPECDGVIATAAVCDYRPKQRVAGKITKTGQPIVLELTETSDVLAELGAQRAHRWVVGFALESQDPRNNAMRKLRMKNCSCIVLNDTSAIGSLTNAVEVLSPEAETIAEIRGTKDEVAERLMELIETSIAGVVY